MISLVIVNYNQERYIGKAIASVLEQTQRDWELLIWDDGSTDSSVAIAREYAQKDNRVRVIAAPHQGVAKARRNAVAETKGNYIGWVDSDDWIAKTTLAETVKVLDSNPEVGMVYTDYYDVNVRGKAIGIGKRCHIPYSPHRLLVDFMTFHFRLLRRSVYEQIGGINCNCEYAYDYDLCLRLSEVTKVERIQKPLYYYRHHGQNITYRQRKEQIQSSQIAINQALQRRGLADSYVLEVKGDRFCLRKKETKVFVPLAPKIWGEQSSQNPPNIGGYGGRGFRGSKDLSSNLLKTAATLITVLPFTAAIAVNPASAQSIIPNNDGTMTVITKDGSTFNIDGGTLSGDGKNLFHSFREFGLDAGEIANFLSNPNIQNILGRINGGNPSLINGLIQVTGGNSNLFLMNPSGIIFGNNASLNVPGDFSATTATGIGFGDGWFNAVGTNDYLNLVGNPDSFNFTNAESGVIINAGDLKVADGSNISLTGGTVISTGTIETEGGNITVAAVPGTNRVLISQEGQLLKLEVAVPQNANGEALPIRVVDLPNLLRGLPVEIETGLEVAANNDVTVANSNTVIPNEPGTTIVSGTVDVSNTQPGGVSGEAQLLGGKVGLIGANIDASGDAGGGEVLVGGDYKGQGTVPNAEVTLVDRNSEIKADARQDGDGGEVIVWADKTTQFNGNISARGGNASGDGGFIEVSGKNNLVFNGTVDTSAPNGNVGDLLLDPTNIEIVGSGYADTTNLNDVDQFSDPDLDPTNSITRIENTAINNATSNVTLQANNDITFSDPVNIINPGVGLTAQANNDINVNSDITTTAGNITLTGNADNTGSGAVNITNATVNANGGNINLVGTGADGESFGIGVGLENANVQTIGSGAIVFEGTSGVGTTENPTENHGIKIFNNSSVSTVDGNITLTGTAETSNGDLNHGVFILGINSGGEDSLVQTTGTGSIQITGVSNATGGTLFGNDGISIVDGGQVRANGEGEITLIGTGGLEGSDSDGNQGIVVLGTSLANSFIESSTGNITLTGTGRGTGTNNSGILLGANGDGRIESTAGENIRLTGIGNNSPGILLRDGAIIDGGNISLTADEITNEATTTPATIQGTGILQIQPNTNTLDISIGGTVDDARLNLDDSELGSIQDGFSQTIIGREDGTGTLTIDNNGVFFTNPVTLQANNIEVNGLLEGRGDASITLIGAGTTTTLNADITTQGQPILIDDNVILGTDVNLNTTDEGFAGANITIDGTVNNPNDPDSFDNNLTLTAGTGEINITGAIGDTNPIGFIDANSSSTTTFGSTINADSLFTDEDGITILNGNLTTTLGQFYGDAVELGQDVEIATGNGYGVTFNSTVRSLDTPRSLAITTTGDEFSDEGITFNGAVGDNNQPLLSLETNTNTGITNINGGSVITTENQTYNTDISIGNFNTDTQLIADSDNNGSGNFNSQNIDGDGQNLSIQAGSTNTGNIDNNFGGDEGGTGNINLSSPGNITTGYIDGGEITIDSNGVNNNTQGLFTSTATLSETTNISIRGTTVTIEHGGGNTSPERTPFIVGDATTNGTAGDIVSASETVTAISSFPDTFISPNETIQIITTDELPIVAANDGTGSVVTRQQDGVTFNLTGGTLSGDGQNLFHSYTRFDLPESNQIANFVIIDDSLDNILARVSSGDASDIQGTIQVTGGNPNLFLLNPAGIIFGSDAQLNVPAAFIASTGNGIRFGDNWFSASGTFSASVLNGIPDAVSLTSTNPGSIINNANLTNNNGSLNLIGGTVVNSGDVTSNGFNAIALNEGASIVNITDFTISSTEGVTNLPNPFTGDVLTFADLIELIGEDITVNPTNADDTALEIQNPINSNGQDINLIGNSNNTQGVRIENDLDAGGGNITITGTSVAEDGVFIRGQVTTSGTGTINVTGTSTEDIGILTLGNNESTEVIPTQITTASGEINLTGTSTNSIGVSTQTTNITSTDSNVTLTGDEIDLLTGTNITGDTVTLQPETSESNIAIAPTEESATDLDITQAELDTIEANSISIGNATDGSGTITVDNPITLDESIALNSSQTNLNGDITTEGNEITINGDVTLQNNVALNAISNEETGTNININGSVNGANNLILNAGSGNINLQGNVGNTTTVGSLQAIGTISTSGNDLNITANDILVENIDTTNNPGGNTTLNSTAGAIETGNIDTSGTTGGNVTLNSANTIETGAINSSGSEGNGGNVTLNSGEDGDIRVGSIRAEGNSNNGGDIKVNVDNNNPGLFVAESSFPLNGVATSIYTNSSSSEAITIKHGGNGEIPFEVGNPELLERDRANGTVGAIIAGNNQINDESFLFTERRDNISIISVEAIDNNEIGNFESQPPPIQFFETAANIAPPQLPIPSISEAKKILRRIEEQAAQKPALVYISFTSPEIKAAINKPEEYFVRAETCLTAEYKEALGLTDTQVQPTICLAPQPSDRLEIVVITAEGEPIFMPVDVTRAEVEKQAEDLYREVANREELWEEPAELLYEWLISSIEEQLKARDIDNLLFVLPPKLRSLPLATLYDFDTDLFLIEKGYNIGLAPSVNLMNTVYNKDVQNASVLALGASNFEENQNQQALNAVEVELPEIVSLRGGQTSAFNEQFTLENLRSSLNDNNFPIVHLSTHADFSTATIDDIYIQLYDRRLTLNELRSLDLKVGSEDLELLVLSACRSAFGDTDAELGFAGLAVKLGVKTAIGSLWKVSDVTTPGLMLEFYHQLETSTLKAEALRLAQVAMIEEQIKIDLDNRQMVTSWGETIELPENVVTELLARNITEIDLSHPYYWAPFTVIGSPW